MPRIQLNGKAHDSGEATTVLELLEQLGLEAAHVAVERNKVIVARADHASTPVEADDGFEVVTFVGGG